MADDGLQPNAGSGGRRRAGGSGMTDSGRRCVACMARGSLRAYNLHMHRIVTDHVENNLDRTEAKRRGIETIVSKFGSCDD
jgi:hypothetical protein